MEKETINSKIKANAVCAYLLLFISVFFLFNKKNKYLNNNFVHSHVKSAFIIHILFLITYIVFINNSLFSSILVFNFSLNDIIAKILFLTFLFFITIGIYKANSGEKLSSFEIFNFIKNKPGKIIDINGDGKFGEKDKFTILLSYIPIVGFLNYSKYKKKYIIDNNTKLNLIVTIIISLFYIYSHYNLANLLMLFYTIFVVFVGINIFSRDIIIDINLKKIPSFKKLNFLLKSLFDYLIKYFTSREFVEFNKILEDRIKNNKIEEEKELQSLKLKKGLKIPSFLIYIPYINIIFVFIKNSKYNFHIKNGITITFILLFFQIIAYFGYFNLDLFKLIIIPILFGIGYAKNDFVYKMPFIYDIYEFSSSIFSVLKFKTKKINDIRKKEESINLKVK